MDALSNKRIYLVSWDKRNTKLFMDHKSKDAHHGSTSLVQFNCTLRQLGLSIKLIPSVVDEAVAEVSDELSSSDILHDKNLKKSNEGEQLKKACAWNGTDSGKSGGDVRELGTVDGDVSGKSDSSLGEEIPDDGKHGNASMLDLDESKAIEVRFVAISDKPQRIIESKRGLNTKFVPGNCGIEESVECNNINGIHTGLRWIDLLEGPQGSRRGSFLCRSKSNGAGNKGGEDRSLHRTFFGSIYGVPSSIVDLRDHDGRSTRRNPYISTFNYLGKS